ncbi:helix-turn-helix transcriptional regulator [Paenibacillus frigoriresistens]|uniref:AraC family transcriptional regulator n=1 Tax=Paenibacillus alginolyticus TaxID=59839 RepID=UPI001566B34A|nr:AraC family transcriptional regulator [Paenibacillus frigoriresistens]NRF91906.1 helix-turn-helix transcriptional regulator [Paenibacillus frigoriresistens]
MEENAKNEHVNYHHPLLRYKIWDITLEPLPSLPWNMWHYHKEVEIILLFEGSMQVETVDTIYNLQGQDLLIIGSSQLHRTRRQKLVKQIVLQLDILAQLDQYTKDFSPILLELSEPLDRINEVLANNQSVKETMFHLLVQVYQEASHMEPGYELAISGAFKQLLSLLIRHAPSSPPISPADWQRLKPVLDYIELHYRNPVRIQDILHLVHLEYHYFIKYFQQCIGMSFVDYLHLRRIKTAEHLLLTETLSIADVGVQSGFPNVNMFIRIFKRYNEYTPSEFRKKRIQKPISFV